MLITDLEAEDSRSEVGSSGLGSQYLGGGGEGIKSSKSASPI